ncbi:hypothetical protein FOCG_06035 [Fusarium oxysporum f. sp. radicis-lycopersici 26381]|uniref:Uncharacterized protein n=1 Tax=Fusarium oxysporum Fo47 TaxID=660027 RepID=W9K1T9_FUSOX|nr:hypothetical protein FOZG_11696 [Fusarium oxysporum Fo47]EWZ96098.1 hypothetical protein FOWG_03586 [Fusarium oxysporum f. sp. lycopersici MN25]EXL55442.1 hypothetical protein FOCG_06035 [Fusarium oxysporum f. sp. radicis-lycopersici 26381]
MTRQRIRGSGMRSLIREYFGRMMMSLRFEPCTVYFSRQPLVRSLRCWRFLLYSIAFSTFRILSSLFLKGVVQVQGVQWLEKSGGKVYSPGHACVSDQALEKPVCKNELATRALQ